MILVFTSNQDTRSHRLALAMAVVILIDAQTRQSGCLERKNPILDHLSFPRARSVHHTWCPPLWSWTWTSGEWGSTDPVAGETKAVSRCNLVEHGL